jgi:hypothetical protein
MFYGLLETTFEGFVEEVPLCCEGVFVDDIAFAFGTNEESDSFNT